MNAAKVIVCAAVVASIDLPESISAELIVTTRAPHRAALRFNDGDGSFLGFLRHDTEGFYGMTAGPDGRIYLASNVLGRGEVLRFQSDGTFVDVFATVNLQTPGGLCFGPDGHLYVIGSTWPASPVRGQVLRYDGVTGDFIDVFIQPAGEGASLFRAMTFGPDHVLYVADDRRGIVRYNGATGAFIDTFIPLNAAGAESIADFAFGPDGNIYVANSESNSVARFHGATGVFIDVFVAPASGGLNGPLSLTFGPDGHLYTTSRTQAILRFDSRTGAFLGTVASVETTPDLVGPRGLLFVGR